MAYKPTIIYVYDVEDKNDVSTNENKSVEDCIKELKTIGLDDKEIERLSASIDAIINNRLDYLYKI